MKPRFQPQSGAKDLVASPYRYELNAAPTKVQLPALCARCAGLASERLSFSKVFRIVYRNSQTRYEVVDAVMPCCTGCRTMHLAEAPPLSTGTKLASMIFSEAFLVALFPTGIGAFVLWLAAKDFDAGDVERGRMLGAVGLFFVFIGLLIASRARATTARYRVPPLTSVTSAFDFSNNIAQMFEGPRYVYALANERFAKAFIAANGDRQWDPAGRVAQSAKRKRTILMIVAGAVMAAWVIWEIVSAIWPGPLAPMK